MNLTSRPHKSGERMRASHCVRKKTTPRATNFSDKRRAARTRGHRTPLPLSCPHPPFSSLFAERVLRACTLIYAYNVPTLRTVAQELLDRRILFLLLSLQASLSLSLSHSPHLLSGSHFQRCQARARASRLPSRMRVSYLPHNQFGATRYSSTSNS